MDRSLSPNEKHSKFITKAAWYSSEINVHTLTSIAVLVSQGRLPMYAINTHLFSSQPCESLFRSARSLTGALSSMTNFTVHQFLSKLEQISILNHLKSIEANSKSSYALKFPVHQKNRHAFNSKSIPTTNNTSFSTNCIENIIKKAFAQAQFIIKNSSLSKILDKNDLNDLNNLSLFILEKKKTSISIDYSSLNNQSLDEECSVDESSDSVDDDDDDDDDDDEVSEFGDLNLDDSDGSDEDDDNEITRLTSTKETFNGMRIYDKINPIKEKNYFKVTINNRVKYINKQTAARLLTINKSRLSSDRLSRVRQMNRQD